MQLVKNAMGDFNSNFLHKIYLKYIAIYVQCISCVRSYFSSHPTEYD